MQFSLKSLFGLMLLAAVALACLRANSERFAVSAAIGALIMLQAMADPAWDWGDLPLSLVIWLGLSTAFYFIGTLLLLLF